jgi:hypothetical protein
MALGVETRIVDFNLLQHTDDQFAGSLFYANAVDYLLAFNADVYGFTSMAIDSHIGLRLAELIKIRKPEAVTVLGGPHFSSVAEEMRAEYHWVDYVIKGEGEGGFDRLIKKLMGKSWNGTDHGSHERIISWETPESWTAFPNYGLVDLKDYFKLNPRRVLDYEGGRGCRFKCAFCYSPAHYDRVRELAIDRRIKDLDLLAKLGAKRIFFVEDNFLNDPASSLDFCGELERAQLGLTWSCYATLPQLNANILDSMARSGCRSIFMGIDAVGAASQRYYKKRFLRRQSLTEIVRECVKAGIRPTCAFLVSPPSHRCGADLEATLLSALAARNAGADIRLNVLTLYNGTESQARESGLVVMDNLKVKLLMDLPADLEDNNYAKRNPEFFPFHSRYVAEKEWSSFLQVAHCLFTLFYCYPRTLQDTCLGSDISPLQIAAAVLDEIGDLVSIDKARRRDVEADAFQIVMEDLPLRRSKPVGFSRPSVSLGSR